MAKPKDIVKQIKKATRRRFSTDEKIRITLESLRGESTLSTFLKPVFFNGQKKTLSMKLFC